MKSKDLIKLLQEADPAGETHVVVNNHAITDVYPEAGYWDGCGQVIDDDKGHYIKGKKIQIVSRSIRDMMFLDEDFEVEYDDYTIKYKERDDEARQLSKKISFKVDVEAFEKWCQDSFQDSYLTLDIIMEFYKANQKSLEDFSHCEGKSVYDRRISHWDNCVDYNYGKEELLINEN